MSVDGTEAMQQKNRGSDLNELPIHFIKDVWPNSYFKLTLSSDTLSDYAEGVISLYEQGFKIASSLVQSILHTIITIIPIIPLRLSYSFSCLLLNYPNYFSHN